MSSGTSTIAEIQALRAIAVLLVVFYHGGMSWFPGGYIGVDVFFVISGYLITGLLVREQTRSGEISLSRFYARRIRRLFPAAAVTVLAVLAAGWMLYSPLQFKQLTSTAIATTLYLSNFWFFQVAVDYLAAGTHNNALLHTWSLSVEEQFYLFWPLLIIALTRFAEPRVRMQRMMLGLAVLSAVSLVFCVMQTASNQPLAFFGTHARAWEFGIGGMLALSHARGVTSSQGARNLFFIAGLALIFIPSFIYNERTVFPGFAAFWPVLGTALVIHSCSGDGHSALNGWMKYRPVQYIGDVSYSFYLWHWPVAIFLHAYLNTLGIFWVPLYLALSLALAALSYHCVENPVRFSRVLSAGTANAYLFGLGVSVLVLATVGLARMTTVQELEKESQIAYRKAFTDDGVIYSDGCHLDHYTTELPEKCVYGQQNASKSIALFGDSHAASWFPALQALADEQGYRLYSLTKSACPSFYYEPHNRMLNRPYTECTQWRENVFKFLAKEQPDLVLLSNTDEQFVLKEDGERRVDQQQLTQAVNRTRDSLQQSGVRFAVIRDIPRLTFGPLYCLSRAAWREQDPVATCTFDSEQQTSQEILELVSRSLDDAANGSMLDMNSSICPDAQACVLEREGYVLYRDSHHMTASFSRHLSDELFERLKALSLL